MPAKEDKSNVVLATEGLPGSTNKSEQFNYMGECIAMRLKEG